MHHINHFSQGLITPLLAYAMSVIGSLLGLLFTARARGAQGAARVRWLLGAALALGGTGIWVMHFIAMMGFSITLAPIRFDVRLTVVSAVVAVVVVGAGLLLVSYGGARPAPLLGGGLLTGLGVLSMHYMGMAAMNTTVDLSYDPITVLLSMVIAVAASTTALWFTIRVTGVLRTLGAALLMGIAVTGMHYTGMFALSVSGSVGNELPPGAAAIDFLVPLLVGISLLTVGLLMAVMLSPSEKEMRSEAELLARIEERRERMPAPPPAANVMPPAGRHTAYGGGMRQAAPPPEPSDRPSLFDPRSRP